MSDKLIACENLKDEIELVLKDLKLKIEIIWIDSGLHNFPQELNKKLQSEIDKIDDEENILLLFGRCGNSTVGLHSEKAKIICPKVSDCISLCLGGDKSRLNIADATQSYFFTKRQIENNRSLYNEMKRYIEKHGDIKSKKVYDMMFKNYKYITVIDTGAYDIDDILNKTKYVAQELSLNHKIVKGDLSLFYKLFKKEWDEEFICLDKGENIEFISFIG